MDLGLVVDPPQAPARERREPDEKASRRDQCTPCAEQVDRDRREQRAGAHGRDHDELEQAEDASDHPLVCVLLHDREPRDVEKAVRKARQREAQDGDPRLGPGGEHDERQSPPGEGELEGAPEPAAADERDTRGRTEDPSHAERGGEDPDT